MGYKEECKELYVIRNIKTGNLVFHYGFSSKKALFSSYTKAMNAIKYLGDGTFSIEKI